MLRLTTVLVLAAAAFAQEPPPMGPPPGDGPAPGAMRLRRLAKPLKLTDAQKTKAAALFEDAADATQALQSKIRANREELEAAIKKNDAAKIDALSAAAGTLLGQRTAIQSKAQAAFYALLTPEQQAKYDALDERGPGGPVMGGPGMGGPGGPGMMGRPMMGRPPEF